MLCCRLAELRKTERLQLLEKLTEYPLAFDGHEGYAKVHTGPSLVLDSEKPLPAHSQPDDEKPDTPLNSVSLCAPSHVVWCPIAGRSHWWGSQTVRGGLRYNGEPPAAWGVLVRGDTGCVWAHRGFSTSIGRGCLVASLAFMWPEAGAEDVTCTEAGRDYRFS